MLGRMRWDDQHSSPDLIDRRGARGGGGLPIGGLMYLLPFLMRSPLGWLVILAAVGYFVCTNLRSGDGDVAHNDNKPGSGEAAKGGGPADREAKFVGFVLDDAQNTWAKLFEEKNMTYPRAKLVLFTDATQTGCGYGQAATGPFYCPRDSRVYIDLGFWDELSTKLGAKGEFAQAYVVAHEIGHHVQNVLGKSDEVHAAGNAKGSTSGSVRLELQADCYAGIWAHSTAQRDLLENGDLESALNAAQSIGDDRLQKMQKGTVRPESFTHGTSEQRMRWFKKGYETGRMEDCDTFSAANL
jgi:uncharacterized protein